MSDTHRLFLDNRLVLATDNLLTSAQRDTPVGNSYAPHPGGRDGQHPRAYLCDFGIARHAASSSSLTTTGQFLGTLQDCAPEQIQGQRVNGRTDQYALACVAYHCLTGQTPYTADEPSAVMFAHLSAGPPRLSVHNPALPPAIDHRRRHFHSRSHSQEWESTMAVTPDGRHLYIHLTFNSVLVLEA
jgi:serine/threonine protein kinase